MEEETERKKYIIFGRDISTIPCFRSSWLFGVSGGVGSGLLYFLFSSKPGMSTHVGFFSMIGITGIYWCVCRYDHERKLAELEQMKEYLAKRVLIEGTEMEKLYDAEVVEVSNKPKEPISI